MSFPSGVDSEGSWLEYLCYEEQMKLFLDLAAEKGSCSQPVASNSISRKQILKPTQYAWALLETHMLFPNVDSEPLCLATQQPLLFHVEE
jgi:hypothetical protein